ncbi:ADP-ribose glycohydrolase MACROD2 [Pelomyxa schiedti]|nr:ADP-ribose glycohydrolase MACROD2 [Pelomyxa schiedti]
MDVVDDFDDVEDDDDTDGISMIPPKTVSTPKTPALSSHSASTGKSTTNCNTNPIKPTDAQKTDPFQWFWLDDKMKWIQYSQEISQKLEAARATNQEKISVDGQRFVDLRRMQQARYDDPQKRRGVKREVSSSATTSPTVNTPTSTPSHNTTAKGMASVVHPRTDSPQAFLPLRAVYSTPSPQKNKIVSSNVSATPIWQFWLGEQGKMWQAYPSKVSNKIEEAFIKHASIVEVDAERYIDFAHGLQRRYDDDERKRYVKRTGPPACMVPVKPEEQEQLMQATKVQLKMVEEKKLAARVHTNKKNIVNSHALPPVSSMPWQGSGNDNQQLGHDDGDTTEEDADLQRMAEKVDDSDGDLTEEDSVLQLMCGSDSGEETEKDDSLLQYLDDHKSPFHSTPPSPFCSTPPSPFLTSPKSEIKEDSGEETQEDEDYLQYLKNTTSSSCGTLTQDFDPSCTPANGLVDACSNSTTINKSPVGELESSATRQLNEGELASANANPPASTSAAAVTATEVDQESSSKPKEIATLTSILSWDKWLSKKTRKYLTPKAPFNGALNSIVSLWRGDITTLQVDAIVNAAKASLMGGGGIDGAIHKAAGPRLHKACLQLQGCDPGNAVVTRGYNLQARYIIHTVGPIGEDEPVLAHCYTSCLELAKNANYDTLAFCCISTGIYGYPNKKAAKVALKTTRSWLESNSHNFTRIVFCVYLPKDKKLYKALMPVYFPPLS